MYFCITIFQLQFVIDLKCTCIYHCEKIQRLLWFFLSNLSYLESLYNVKWTASQTNTIFDKAKLPSDKTEKYLSQE
jgi:hypothetical protein